MPTRRINGIDLYYETAGEGPPVLLIHGLGSSTRDWDHQIPELAGSYRVIALDVRGHGRSGKPPGPYSMRQFADDAVELLRELDAIPAHVIGLSMGGMIAFQMAVDAASAVRSLVIANSGPEMILRKFSERFAIRSRFAVVRWFGMRKLGQMIAGRVLPEPQQAELRQRFEDAIAANDPRAYMDSLRALIGWSVAARIGGIRSPVLVIASDRDYTPVEWKQAYVSQIPGARLAVIENSRHLAPFDQAGKFNRLLTDFLAGVDVAA
jgi:pimeloyl-ACP methyl ester carboxylesterase